MMEFQTEVFDEEFGGEWVDLARQNWQEFAELCPAFDPDMERFYMLEEVGCLRTFSMRDRTKLVGYLIYVVARHPYDPQRVVADEINWYIHPDYRRGRNAIRFLRYAEDRLREDGVDAVTHHSTVGRDLGSFYERYGYRVMETLYVKDLRQGLN